MITGTEFPGLTATQINTLIAAFSGSVSHTHTKSQISDLETITATPTSGAVPKADGSGKLDAGWLPTGASGVSDETAIVYALIF
jgi:hypothetical protein